MGSLTDEPGTCLLGSFPIRHFTHPSRLVRHRKMETTNGKRSAKGQSRDPKAEIRKAESVGRTGHPVPRKIGHGRGDETTWQEITVGVRQTASSSVEALEIFACTSPAVATCLSNWMLSMLMLDAA